MELRLSVTGVPGADVLVDADPGCTIADVGAEVGRVLGRQAAELYVDGAAVDPGLALGGAPLRDGLRVGIGAPVHDPTTHGQGLVEVRVVGGPAAGVVCRLGPGTATIGSGTGDWIRLADTDVAKAALEIDVAHDGAVSVTVGESVTATLEGEQISGARPWPRGHLIALGRTLLSVETPDFPDASLTPSAEGGGWDYNRPPRLAPPEHQTSFNLPSKPKAQQNRPLPWVMAIVPLVAAITLALVLGRMMMLAFAIFSPVMIFANSFNDKKQGKKSFSTSVQEYRQRRADIEADVVAALGAEQAVRRSGCPDPALAGLIAAGPRHRLWERRRTDVDFGHLRLGVGTLPSAVAVTNPGAEEHRRRDPIMLTEVPVTVPMCSDGVLGVAGSWEDVRAIGRWLVAQAAILHSPRDLQICVLTNPDALDSWSWLRWLPHAALGPGAPTLLGAGGDTVGRRISELQTLLNDRQAAMRETGKSVGTTYAGTELIVVLDGSRRLRALPGVAQILREGPEVGIRLVCLDTDERLLPEECNAVASLNQAGWLRLRRAGQVTVNEVRPDYVSPEWCDDAARAMAPIRDVTDEDDSALPNSARLLDLLGLEPPGTAAIVERWAAGGRSTEAVIGAGMDGRFTIDLVRDGPHGLMAGTTGSGKSELLQTIVASLAVVNRPDAMTFVLVDYKGGSAFKDCVKLPHTVGMVTDLDTHLVSRALESLGAELRRREHILAAAGAKDLEDYVDACKRDANLAPMPRLLIVIDEFASLARELPDFVTGLVNIAQRGRSLGIHLILATQRPSGVVSPEIRANTNLRIALRVTGASESSDIIDAPDAARIAKSTPGRAYVRLGHSSLLPFQSGRVGGRRRAANTQEVLPPWAAVFDTERLGNPPPSRPKAKSEDSADLATDLGDLVAAIRGAADQLAVPTQHSPWLPALPDQVTLDDLRADGSTQASTDPLALQPVDGVLRSGAWALVDVPAEQSRRAESVDLHTFGHLFIAGAPRSGRSQTLRSIAGAVAGANTAANVHLYGLDCGNGALLPLVKLPHCGAVVRSTDADRASRLLGKLMEEMRRRMALLGAAGYTDISEQRAGSEPAERLPHVVVLIDRWEGFVATLGERDNNALTDTVFQLLREGASAGIHVVIAGDHTLLSGRISTLTEHKLALRLSDKADYSQIGVNPKKIPDGLPSGRGYWAGSGLQAQVALLAGDPSGHAQSAAIERIAEEAAARDKEIAAAQRPFGVDVLPTRIELNEAWELRVGDAGHMWSMVGVGGDNLTALGPDLAAGMPAFVIAGPPQSGRSTALCTMATASVRAGAEVVLIAGRESPVQHMEGAAGVLAVYSGTGLDSASLNATMAAARGPVIVFIDDAELLKECAATDALSAIVRRQCEYKAALVIAGDPDSLCSGFGGWQPAVKKARRGLLLSPQSITDADLVGTRLTRTAVGQPVIPGRGLLCLGGGDTIQVQVPVP